MMNRRTGLVRYSVLDMSELPTFFYRPAEAMSPAGSFDLPPDLLAKSRARIERLAVVMLVGVSLGTLITQVFQMGGAARSS